MISGESTFMDTQQIQHQIKIDEDTEIIATHHRLNICILFGLRSRLICPIMKNTTTSQIENITLTLL